MELLSDQGLRVDGRRAHELRNVECRLGVFGRADGSAYLEQGNTRVLATVYGPHEARAAQRRHDVASINCQYRQAVFSGWERGRRAGGGGDRRAQELGALLQNTLESVVLVELYPRSQIDVYVQVLQADGGTYATCVNAATLALIDAGVALRDYVCACSASVLRDQPLVDLNSLETSGAPELTAALLPRSGRLPLLEMSQRFHVDKLGELLDVAETACRDVHTILNRAVRRHVSARSSEK
ncbi:exosome complex component RRP41-like [Amphibalanus amphitrite]|nr:exosome complex component RRP41-like [Amphibalanus amphitrite]XP_043198161.1 exosome complex component RRP41-like [Amphibalanus amphitrite]XP_043198162.1 exosome complex component RRP41-like [Amphibalanus amphitrite]